MTLLPSSLRLRLTLLVAGIVAATLLVAGLAVRAQFRTTLEDNARQTATTLLDDFLEPTATGLGSIDGLTRFVYLDEEGSELSTADVDAIVTAYLEATSTTVIIQEMPLGDGAVGALPVEVTDADAVFGNVVVAGDLGSPGLPAFEALDDDELAAVFDDGAVQSFAVELFAPTGEAAAIDLDDDAITVGRPVEVGAVPLTVAVSIPSDSIDDSVAAATLVGLVAIPLLTLLVAAVAWTVTARTLRPVEAIRRQVELTDPSRLDHHVPRPGGGGEIDRLAGTMNDMLDRLHAASQQHRRFVSDASHELRSPITATLATVETTDATEVGERWPDVAATITTEQHRLERLVDDLLLLAELDERPDLTADLDEVDLDELVLAEVARPRSVAVTAIIDAPHRRPGSERLLGRAVSNLVDNAARHASSRVEVALLLGDDEGAVIRVDDDGPGIAEEDRTRIVDRFARLDEARHRSDGGAGLGLAIVSEVARHHGGALRVGQNPAGGARFEIVLPSA